MVKIRYKKTGLVEEVTNNVAHGLIEAGKVELVRDMPEDKKQDRELRPHQGKRRGYMTK